MECGCFTDYIFFFYSTALIKIHWKHFLMVHHISKLRKVSGTGTSKVYPFIVGLIRQEATTSVWHFYFSLGQRALSTCFTSQTTPSPRPLTSVSPSDHPVPGTLQQIAGGTKSTLWFQRRLKNTTGLWWLFKKKKKKRFRRKDGSKRHAATSVCWRVRHIS